MASVLKNKDEKEPKAGDREPAREERDEEKETAKDSAVPDYRAAADDRRAAAATTGPGFFTLYKPGHGYWTRMGTAIGAGLLGLLTAHFLYSHLPVWLPDGWDAASRKQFALGAAAALLVVYGIVIWWLMNKPGNADFLIATDSEMKKVNWTSRRELIGSTKVVIIFMFLIAGILFVIDVIFGYLFHLIGILKYGPFGS